MKSSARAFPCLAILAVLGASGLFANPVDDLLQTPPDRAQTSNPNAAAQRLAEIGKLEADFPDRRDELEAWAIPLRAATPAQKAAAQAEPRTFLVLVRRPSGNTLIHARSAKSNASAVVITDTAGNGTVVNRNDILSVLPWMSDDAIAAQDPVDVQRLIGRYQALEATQPALRGQVAAEISRMKAAAGRENAELEKAKPRIAEIANATFLPQPSTNARDLARQLLEIDALSRLSPNDAPALDAAAVPIRDALENLWAGRIFNGTQWVDGAEARRVERAEEIRAMHEKYEGNSRIPVDGVLLSDSEAWSVVQWTFGPYLLGALVGLVLLLCRGTALRLLGLAAIAGSLGWGWYQYRALFAPPPAMPAAEKSGDPASALAVVLNSQEARLGLAPRSKEKHMLKISEADLNAFLDQRVALEKSEAGAGAKSVQSRVTDGHFLIDAIVNWRDRDYLVQYDCDVASKPPAPPKVTVNGTSLPARAARHFVNGMETVLDHAMREQNVIDTYYVSGTTPGAIEVTAFARLLPPPKPPKPKPTPKPTPVPTPRPTPTPEPSLWEMLGIDPPPEEAGKTP